MFNPVFNDKPRGPELFNFLTHNVWLKNYYSLMLSMLFLCVVHVVRALHFPKPYLHTRSRNR